MARSVAFTASQAILVFVVLAAREAEATTWVVEPDGSGDAPTIQAALDSAQVGDEVVLAPGTYTRTSQGVSVGTPLADLKAGVDVRGQAGAAATVLDGEGSGRLLRAVNVGTIVIEGLTIRRGVEPDAGGGLLATGTSSPTIRECVFEANNVGQCTPAMGGAIQCGVATIEDCTFRQNWADAGGGGIRCANAQIRRCVFLSNRGGCGDVGSAGAAVYGESATIEDSYFEDNIAGGRSSSGGAVYDGGQPSILRCTFVNNDTDRFSFTWGGSVRLGPGTIEDCLIVGGYASRGGAIMARGTMVRRCAIVGVAPGENEAVYFDIPGVVELCTLVGCGDGIYMPAGGTVHRTIVANSTVGPACRGNGTWTCSNLFGNAGGNAICGTDGGGNFSADPVFCALDPVASRNVGISDTSPCAPGNHPNNAACDLVGAGAVGCATTAVERAAWGEIKNRYRSR